MILTYVWMLFLVLAFILALVQFIFDGNHTIFSSIVTAIFDQAKLAVEISIGIIGLMSFWLGIMRIAEKGGMVAALSKIVSPVFSKLFPDIPKNHPVFGAVMMNFSANIMGLDNAATPLGLKAMKGLQALNPHKATATNAQIMFLTLNASSLTLLPITVFAYRQAAGSVHPTDVFIPIIFATFCSTLAGCLSVAFLQKINLLQRSLFIPLAVFIICLAVLMYFLSSLSQNTLETLSTFTGNFLLFGVIVFISVKAYLKKVNIFDSFIEGAKEGIGVAIKIIPYLVGILVLVGVFRASGGLDYLTAGIEWTLTLMGIDTEFVKALPVAFMKPLSGSGARGLMVDIMNEYGADSFPSRVAAIIQGSTETTFYVIAVYYGSVAVKNIRYTLGCALFAELAGVVAAIILSYFFFA